MLLFISQAFALRGKHSQLCGFRFKSSFTAPQLSVNAFKCWRGDQLKHNWPHHLDGFAMETHCSHFDCCPVNCFPRFIDVVSAGMGNCSLYRSLRILKRDVVSPYCKRSRRRGSVSGWNLLLFMAWHIGCFSFIYILLLKYTLGITVNPLGKKWRKKVHPHLPTLQRPPLLSAFIQ